MSAEHVLGPGSPEPLGATPDAEGVNFAVYSANATRMLLCLFDADGLETARLPLPEHTCGVWHGHVAGLKPGQLYGYRAEGPWAPGQGHRFNARKLLVDPYTRALSGPLVWDPALMCHAGPHGQMAEPRDSGPYVPKSVVTEPQPPADEARPRTPWSQTVIYEAHVKGLTMQMPGVKDPGTYKALGDPKVIAHLQALGVTAIELLPIHGFIEDRHLADRGLTNYWGYQTLTFFAPERRYAATDDPAAEFREAVKALHGAGIEVILDVVYNHSCEGDWEGPTLMFRGLDNATYYRLGPDGHSYLNDTGTGNTLDCAEPAMQRLVMDSLRFWAGEMGVDGFRFDLGTVLGREGRGFDPGAGLLDAMRQDPLLRQVKLIAEPWDVGPGGYQVGAFPPPFAEWNDVSRDTMRAFWRGDPGQVPHLSRVIAGSAGAFDHSGRPATSSINFLTAHDGFTLADVVSYNARHNEANGEDNRDGHAHNISDNMGVEGPTDDPKIQAARDRRRRNMIATLLAAQGTPMLLAGDELGNSQSGNNNAYVQDNPTGWLDWEGADPEVVEFVARAVRLRRACPMMGQRRFLHAEQRADGLPDLTWYHPDGHAMRAPDWEDDELFALCVEKRMAAGTPDHADSDLALFMVFNAGAAVDVVLPRGNEADWQPFFWSAEPPEVHGGAVRVPEHSVAVLKPADDQIAMPENGATR
ncbi:glycogen debranching protein GlgX [Halovulum sp. GXIMD14794]